MKPWLLPLLLFPFLLSSPLKAESPDRRPAEEEPPPSSGPEVARRLGLAGLGAYGKSNYQEALELFEKAEQAAHSPVFLLYIARCYRALGREEEARALLYELSREPTEGDIPEAWARARSQADSELAELLITSSDGAEREPAAELPEAHRKSSASGATRAPADRSASPKLPSTASRMSPQKKGALVAYGAGTVGLIVMITTGTMAFIEASQVRSACVDGRCPSEELPRAEEAQRLANLATAGATSALVGAAAGTLLLLLPSKEDAPRDPSEGTTASPDGPRLGFAVRGLGLGVELRF